MKATLERCYYQGVGKHLLTDTLTVEFTVNGEWFEHQLPNQNWGYKNRALQFMAYTEIRPTDFEGGSYNFEGDIAVPVVEEDGGYYIAQKALKVGMAQLDAVEWFNPEGTVWNSGENKAFGGINTEPSTGNRAAVEE